MRVGMMENIKSIHRVGRKEGEVEKGEVLLVELVSLYQLIIVFLRNSLILNIPNALLIAPTNNILRGVWRICESSKYK